MLNKFAKISLVATSLAPILLILSVIEFFEPDNSAMDWHAGWWYLILAVLMVGLCFFLVWRSDKDLEKLPVKIKSVRTVDGKIINYLLVYLLPLIDLLPFTIGLPALLIIAFIIFFVMQNAHVYNFNPLLNALGYHFYEVSIEKSDITYLLVTKQTIVASKSISQVVQITEYMMLESSHAK